MTQVEKDIQSDLERIHRAARSEANRILLIWGGFGALCALTLWWLL